MKFLLIIYALQSACQITFSTLLRKVGITPSSSSWEECWSWPKPANFIKSGIRPRNLPPGWRKKRWSEYIASNTLKRVMKFTRIWKNSLLTISKENWKGGSSTGSTPVTITSPWNLICWGTIRTSSPNNRSGPQGINVVRDHTTPLHLLLTGTSPFGLRGWVLSLTSKQGDTDYETVYVQGCAGLNSVCVRWERTSSVLIERIFPPDAGGVSDFREVHGSWLPPGGINFCGRPCRHRCCSWRCHEQMQC